MKVQAELEEQRCLIEKQQVEIQRHRHQIDLQRRSTAHMQSELDAIKARLQQTAPSDNGNGHRAPRRPEREASSSSDRM